MSLTSNMGDEPTKLPTHSPSDRKDFNKSNKRTPNKKYNSERFAQKKRTPFKPFQRNNDLYITNKSNFKAQLKQCEEILNGEEGEVFLHAIGNAINRAINLSLILVSNSCGAFAYEANTSTIELIDDFHPLRDEDDLTIRQRMNSCLHIRVFRQSKNVKA